MRRWLHDLASTFDPSGSTDTSTFACERCRWIADAICCALPSVAQHRLPLPLLEPLYAIAFASFSLLTRFGWPQVARLQAAELELAGRDEMIRQLQRRTHLKPEPRTEAHAVPPHVPTHPPPGQLCPHSMPPYRDAPGVVTLIALSALAGSKRGVA